VQSVSVGQRPPPVALRLAASARRAGFDDVGTYLRGRYLVDRWSAREIGDEPSVSDHAVLRWLRAAGVRTRRRGHRFYEERQKAGPPDPVNALLRQSPPPDFKSWSAYLDARRTSGSRLKVTQVAAELGLSLWHVQRLEAIVDRSGPHYWRNAARRQTRDG